MCIIRADNSNLNWRDESYDVQRKKKWCIFKEKEREEKKKLHDRLASCQPPTYASDNPIITKIFGGALSLKGRLWPDVVERCLRI